ncbi:tetratricopeptide repeat-containing sulfotransferase family protein [Sinimarinibacterium thermocellulolyticum]|uniref:Sulfotransferase n=1 Tax=Sinimarinibacterium thermocellulolyticum TaxID=3170016 RepID=A0ABV2ADU7_9GAMM
MALCSDAQCGADAFRGLAAVCWRQGQLPAAIEYLRQAVSIAPDHADAHADLAIVLMHARQNAQALPHWERVIALRPNDPDVWHNYGKLLGDLRQLQPACAAFERSLALAPDRLPTLMTYARVLASCGDEEAAQALWNRVIGLQPQRFEGYQGLAELQFACGQLEAARDTYARGVAAAPDAPELHMGLAQLREDLGDREGAEAAFREALRLRPDWPLALEGLLTLIRGRAEPALLAQARAILDDDKRPPQDRANVGFGLGKALDASDADAAFTVWEQANRARRRQIGPFDRMRHAERIDRTIAAFDARQVARLRGQGLADPRPVFVLGMPRSGTSLVEQIIAAHPEAHGFGELKEIARIARRMPAHVGSIQRWPEALSAVTPAALQAAAADYLAVLQKRGGGTARRWIDKAPLNFYHVGLIALMFPRATIIWCRRDPRDICVSIYGENFALEQPFATDLGDLGFFYREYMRLMRHWQSVLGDRLHACVYEELVAAPESGARALIAATGLEWHEACLNFYQSDRAVLTPSRWQVRQPMYSHGVGRWRRYAHRLGPLIEALGDELT